MRLREIQRLNVARAQRWHRAGLQAWSELEWAGAMAGEAGEACNAAKKLKRIQGALQHIDRRVAEHEARPLDQQAESYRQQIADEVADTIIYGLLLMALVGRDAETVIADVFNAKSQAYGFPERLAPGEADHNQRRDEA